MVDKTRPRSLSKPRISLKPRPSKTDKNAPDVMKLLHVTVTVVSLSGVYFKESTKAKNAGDGSTSGPKVYPKTTVVASFSRDGDNKDAALDEHVRSLPLDLSKPTPKAKNAPKETVVWPTKEMNGNTASTFQFERYFLLEKQKKKSKKKEQHMYASQSCRVQLAVCRNRRWFKLGDADIVIHGEERAASFTVPLINHDTPKSKKSKGNVIPMARLKGETLKCGLGSNAALQVVVNVSEYPNVEKILHPNNLATVVSWEYDPTKAAVVKKSQKGVIKDDEVAQKGYLLTETSAYESKVPEKKEDHSDEKKTENLDTIASTTMFSAAGKEPSEVTKVASLPVRSSSTASKADSKAYSMPASRRDSNSSRPENILDKITTVVNEPSSPQASTSTSVQQSEAQASTLTPPQIPVRPVATRGFSPIRVSSPMRNLSPFRALSPLRQNSDSSSLNKSSVLDRVVTITADPVPSPRARSLSEHLASTPPRPVKGNDQSIYFIEHDNMQPSDESNPLDPPSADEMKKTRTRSSITMSTEKSSQMSESENSQSGIISRDASTFNHSHNSAFSTASGYSSSKASADPSSNPHTDEDMAVVMAELLEKSPSELYAIIHDIDPKEAKKMKREKERSSKRRSSKSKSRQVVEEEEEYSVESEHSDGSETYDYESIGESSFFYESEGDSEHSESYISFVEERRKSKRSHKANSLAEKIFGRRFLCNFPMCGIGQKGDDKTLSYVDDKETYVNGKEYIRGNNSSWTGSSSSSSDNRLSRLGSSMHGSVDFY